MDSYQHFIAYNVRRLAAKRRAISTPRTLYWSLKLLSLGSITLIVFILPHLMPGTPITLYASWPITPQQQERLMAEYGFDHSLMSQYIIWLQRLVTGQWGSSRFYQRPVLRDTWAATGLTLILLLWTIMVCTVWLALCGGLRRLLAADSVRPNLRFLPVLATLPNFLVALLMRDVLVWHLGWTTMANLPFFDPHYLLNPLYMLLPASALALTPLLVWHQRGMPLLGGNPSLPAGQSHRQRWAQFCLRFRPLLDGFLLEVLLTEYVFSLPGLGSLGIAALKRRDFPMLQGFFLCAAGLYLLLRLVLEGGMRAWSLDQSRTDDTMTGPVPLSPSRHGIYSGVWCLGALLALAIWGPQFMPHDPAEIHSNDQLLLPGYRYILGTDFLGRDVLSRTVEGFRSIIPRVILVTALSGGIGWLLWLLSRLLPRVLRQVGKAGLELVNTLPPFLLAFMVFLVVEQHNQALEIALMGACVPLIGQFLAMPAPLLHRFANLIRLGSLVLILTVTFFFLNITTESFVPTWGGDIRLGLNYSHINIWILLTPSLAITWSRYSFHLVSDHLPALASLATS
jgi:peptide/nickel transport system permease protein